MDFDWLKKFAPMIGTALGGPLAGLAVTAATQALGCDEKTTDGLAKALAGATPDDLYKLKQADEQFQVTMKTLDIGSVRDLEALMLDDRKDARAMEVATKSNVPRNLTYVLTAGMTGLMLALVFKGIPESAALNLLLGSYTTAWLASVTYWFGTTHGSSTKTDLLANSTPVPK